MQHETVQLALNVPHAKSKTEIIDKILGSLGDAAEGDNAREQAHGIDCSANGDVDSRRPRVLGARTLVVGQRAVGAICSTKRPIPGEKELISLLKSAVTLFDHKSEEPVSVC